MIANGEYDRELLCLKLCYIYTIEVCENIFSDAIVKLHIKEKDIRYFISELHKDRLISQYSREEANMMLQMLKLENL